METLKTDDPVFLEQFEQNVEIEDAQVKKKDTSTWCSLCHASKKKCPQLSFFSFPRDAERSREWLDLCQLNRLKDTSPQYLHQNVKICSNHFTPSCISRGVNRTRLTQNAVPTIIFTSWILGPKVETTIASLRAKLKASLKSGDNCLVRKHSNQGIEDGSMTDSILPGIKKKKNPYNPDSTYIGLSEKLVETKFPATAINTSNSFTLPKNNSGTLKTRQLLNGVKRKSGVTNAHAENTKAERPFHLTESQKKRLRLNKRPMRSFLIKNSKTKLGHEFDRNTLSWMVSYYVRMMIHYKIKWVKERAKTAKLRLANSQRFRFRKVV